MFRRLTALERDVERLRDTVRELQHEKTRLEYELRSRTEVFAGGGRLFGESPYTDVATVVTSLLKKLGYVLVHEPARKESYYVKKRIDSPEEVKGYVDE